MNKLIPFIFAVAVLLQGCGSGYGVKTSDAVTDKHQAPRVADVKIKGEVGKKIDTFLRERVQSDFAKNDIFAEAEYAFINPQDDSDKAVGHWRGEFWGKLAISAARSQEYLADNSLKESLKKTARNVIACQHDDGYIGSYKNKLFVKVTDLEASKKIMGWRCEWCWNLWCRKYTLWGLLAIYENTREPDILEAARRSAEQYIDMLEENKIKICDTGTFVGMPSMSILKPMLILYRHTGDKKFLNFSKEIVSYWDRDDGRAPNFIRNAKTGKPIHEWYEKPEKWAKAYEMMSCLQGLLEYYRVTGDKRCLETVEKMHALIWKHERNPIDGVGYNDMFANAANELNGVTETCDSIHWMRLNHELFLITGEAKYMDIFETTAFNAFLAGVYRDGKWASRGVRSHTCNMTEPGQKALYSHCCVNNVPRGLMDMVQSTATFNDDNEIFVNLYLPATINVGGAKIEMTDGYLQTGELVAKVTTKSEKTIKFRIPPWSKNTIIDGKKVSGEWAEVEVDGQKHIQLKFDFTPRIIDNNLKEIVGGYQGIHQNNSVTRWITYRKQFPQKEHMVTKPFATLRVGPLLLAKSKKVGSFESEIFSKKTVNKMGATCKLFPQVTDNTIGTWVARITKPNGEEILVRVCDLASAGDSISYDDPLLYSIFF